MRRETNRHPVFAIDCTIPEAADGSQWYEAMHTILGKIRSYAEDPRSCAAICSILSEKLRDRSDEQPGERDGLTALFNGELVPLWEHEMDKHDNWLHIANDVYEFAQMVGGIKGRDRLQREARYLRSVLPLPEVIEELFPVSIDMYSMSGPDWYKYRISVSSFCKQREKIERIIGLCNENGWEQEGSIWSGFLSYYERILLSVELQKLDPFFVESMYNKLVNQQDSVNQRTLSTIAARIDFWKFDRTHPSRGRPSRPAQLQ